MNKFLLKLVWLSFIFFSTQTLYAQPQFWGMTSQGGQNDAGVIFKTDGQGMNQAVQYRLLDMGRTENGPSSPIQAADGKLYGMTYWGGTNNSGVLFQYDPATNTYTKKIDFAGINGSNPVGSLMQAADGKLYGMTSSGGGGFGVLFQYDPATNTYTKKIDFAGVTNGSYPRGSLMQAADGKLYGMTSSGGTNNLGVLFQYDPTTNTLIKKVDFAGSTNGSSPYHSLTQAADGKLYGITQLGGTNNLGVLFQYDPATNAYTKKIDFAGATNGSNPFGSLMQAGDGKLYGTTQSGGANNYGVLFQYDPATNAYTKKIDFAGSNGFNPNGALMQANDGKLYGMTWAGGTNGLGSLFQYDPVTNTLTQKIGFAGATNGSYPNGPLIQAADGKLYGVTSYGGAGGNSYSGTLFQYDLTTNVLAKKIDFSNATNGRNPQGSLMQAADGKLYGMTMYGGTNALGVLFQFDPATNAYTKKIDFAGATNGSNPYGSLMQAADGKLYGLTELGGTNNLGVLFQYDPATNVYTKKIDFAGATNGSKPGGSLMQAADGKLYGMTYNGGTSDQGILFQYDPATNVYTKKIDFAGATNGSNPMGSLMQAADGKLYGMTSNGGTNNVGVLFQYDPTTNTLIKKIDFAGATNGSNPMGSLMQAADGKLYGVTQNGGTNGVLFQYDPATNMLTKKIDFVDTNGGYHPNGPLIQAADGKLYGTTQNGGLSDNGVLFQYDPATNAYTKTLDFNGLNGKYPVSNLIAIPQPQTITFYPLPNKTLGDPAFALTATASSGLTVSYVSSNPAVATISGNIVTIVGSGTTTITASQAGNASFAAASNVDQTLTVKLNQTITFPALSAKIYGDAPFGLTATASSGLAVSYTSSNPAVATVSGSTVTILGAGSTVITASQAGNSNYNPATDVPQTLTVNKAALTATANNLTKLYGDLNPTLTITYTGFKGADNSSVIDAPPSISTTATQTSNVGNYPISLSGGSDNNYTLTLVNGTLTVNKVTLTATANNLTKIYGDVNPTLTITYTGFKGTDDATVIDTPPSISTTATQTSNVGSYPISLSGGLDNNYSLTLVNGTLTITKAVLTATADAKTKIYGDVNPALTITYTGFKGTDNASVIDTAPSISTTAITTSNVGSYPITLSGGLDNNYSLTLVNGTLTVTKAVLTATANNLSKIYGDINPTLTMTYTGFKGNDDATVIDTPPSISTTATLTSNVGTYPISLSGGSDNNYTITLVNGTLSVNKATLTATADDKTKLYGDVNPPLTITYTGFKGTDNASVIDTPPSSSTTATPTSNTGTYPITLTGGVDNNYLFILVNGTLTINKANQTITFGPLPVKNYGDAPFTLVATSSSGLPVSFSSATLTVATINGSTLTITGAGTSVITASQAGDSNYNPALSVQQTLTVLLPKPTIPSSYVFLINEYATQVDLVTIPGNGNARLVVVKKDGPIDFVPVDNISYTVGQTVGTNNDNFIGLVLSGNASSGTIKNLQPGGTYYFDVYEFNQSNAYYSYLTTATATGGQITMPLATVQVITPINNSTNQNAPTMNVTANTVPSATLYTIELYTNSFFTGTPIVKSGASPTQTFTGLAYSTQYFARVKTNLSTEYGPGTTFTMEPPEADAYLIAPASGSTGNLVSLTVTSNTVNGASTYYIDLSTTSDFSSNVISKSGATTGLSFTGLSFLTTYYVRVKTNLSPNYGVTKSFMTGDAISATYVASPANGATAQATALSVTANTLTGATSYTIQLSPDQTFATGVIQMISGTPTCVFTGLLYNTKYYSRVTSDLTLGQWGAVKNFTTRDHIITAPANNATNVNYSLTLTAAAISGATSYTIEANTSPTFTGGTSIVKTGAASQAFTFAYNTQYYVRVTCNLATGWGSTVTFTTGDPLSLAYVIAPANNATAQATTLNVSTNTLAGATSYTIQLSPDQTFASGVISKTGSSPTQSFANLAYNTKYYSRVTTNLTPGQWGAVENFITRDHVLTTAPANNATNVNYYLTLTAATIAGATIYSIEANTAPDFTGTSIVRSGAASQIFTLAYNTQYYVRVTCNLASGWGSTLTFTTGDPVSLAYVTSPTNGGASNYTTQNVTANSLFGATSYTIELNTNSSFNGTSIVQSGSTNVVTFNGLAPATTYYTRVKTDLSPNWGTTVTSFTTVATGGRVVNDPPAATPVAVTPFKVMVLGNPFQDRLKVLIESSDQTEATIKVVDITGKPALELTTQTNTILEIENDLIRGIYILQVQLGSHVQSVRVMRID